MSASPKPPSVVTPALLRAEIASGLSAAAGRHNFSNRRRRFDVGFSERRRSGAIRAFMAWSFALAVALPVSLIGFYYGWLAEDQYEVEARMILRVNKAVRPDQAGKLTGLPSIEMTRDTQVIAAYLESPAVVSALEAGPGLRKRIEGAQPDPIRPETWIEGDWIARLDPLASAEELQDHWTEISDVDIELPAGIIVFGLRAYGPEDARALASHSVAEAEELVRSLNARVWEQAVAKAEALFEQSAQRLASAQRRLAVARNEVGVLNAEAEAGALSELAASTRSEIIRLEQQYAAQSEHLAPEAARMQALTRRIGSLQAQLDAMSTERVGAVDGEANLAEVMARFSEIEVEQEIAERQFLAAAAKLEEVRQVSEARMMYLDVFVEPALPEEPTYPHRGLWFAIWSGVCLIFWGVASGLFAIMRNHMA